jgi:hypothetical protein
MVSLKLASAVLLFAALTASFANAAALGNVMRPEYEKCTQKLKKCCEKSYQCGTTDKVEKVSKTCTKNVCNDVTVPKTRSVCDGGGGSGGGGGGGSGPKKSYRMSSVRTGGGSGGCKWRTETYNVTEKKCAPVSVDCSTTTTVQVPKFCTKEVCDP